MRTMQRHKTAREQILLEETAIRAFFPDAQGLFVLGANRGHQVPATGGLLKAACGNS